jgi:hypothetical protein
MKKVIMLTMFATSLGPIYSNAPVVVEKAIDADVKSDVKVDTLDGKSKNDVTYLKSGKVRFSSIGYVPKKIAGKNMDLMNAVFEEAPMAMVRMFKAAIAVKKLLAEIEEIKPIHSNEKTGESLYFLTKEEEATFIKNRIKGILEPIEKFMEEALNQSRSIVLVLFAKSLGENARQGFLLPALDSKIPLLNYLLNNILTIEDLKSAISEFFIFFSDLNAGLSDKSKLAYEETLKKLQEAQKNQNNQKTTAKK